MVRRATRDDTPGRVTITTTTTTTQTVAAATSAPSSATEDRELRIALLWLRLGAEVDFRASHEAREFQVRRARKMWGRLGNILRRNSWCQAYRAAHFVPVFVISIVKRWARIR